MSDDNEELDIVSEMNQFGLNEEVLQQVVKVVNYIYLI